MAKAKKINEKVTEVIEETKEDLEELKEDTSKIKQSAYEKLGQATDKTLNFLAPVVDKVRNTVLTFGEIILTISVIIGLVSAILSGFTAMGNVGFFSGLSVMLSEIVKVVMSALVIFLLFSIANNTSKTK